MKTYKTYKTHFGINATKRVLLTGLLLASLIFLRHDATAGQAPVPLGSTAGFAVLGGTTVTSTGATTVTGDLGVAPGTAVVGFPPGTVNGTIHATDAAAAQAQLDLTIAFQDAVGRTTDPVTVSGNLGGQTLAPGLYTSTSSLEISSGDLTLDAQGDANAVFIFQIASTLTTTAGRQVILSGGAEAANIYWQVGSSATLGTASVFKGNILASASITVTTGAAVEGRLLAQTGAVTLDASTITLPAVSLATVLRFGPIHRAADGSVTLVITNTPGLSLTLQTSTDLTNWTTLATQIPTLSPEIFIDTNASPKDTLFYRALYPATSADTTAPTVSATVPANAATGVALSGNITAAFSEAMDPLTISTATLTLKQGTTAVAGTVSYAGVTATFAPAANLAPSTVYTATMTTGAKDLAGNALASDLVWSFTTGATPDTTAPAVSATVPANAASGVAISGKIAATFSEAMDPLTISTATYTLKQGTTAVAGTVSYAGVTAIFTPAGNLAPLTAYTATMTTEAKDLAGNALVSAFVWNFTTGATPDTTRPTVSATVPANAASGVAISGKIAAAFSEAMDPLTISTAVFTLKRGTTAVAGTVSYAGVTATFTPAGNLVPLTSYTATLTTEAKDLAGNALVSSFVWSFTTGATPDTTRPTVSATVPANAATGVPISGDIAAVFSEAMDPLTINTLTFTLKQGTTAVAGTVSYAGVTATFNPLNTLAPNTTYTATVTAGAKDLAGNALATDFGWSFTTGVTPDTTRPTVSATVPVNGVISVAINQTITAAFSEAMDPLAVSTATFTLQQGTAAVAGTVSYAGVTATFTPASALAPLTSYTARITTGVRDLAGNALAIDFGWSFTTGATPDTTAPTVSATVPANAAAAVPINQTINATFSEAMDPLTISTATLRSTGPGGTTVTGTVGYDVLSRIATLIPASDLAPNAVYSVTISTGARDLAGNALAANFVWSFTTAATAAGQSPVALGAASTFAVLAASTVTGTGASTVNGDLGLSPGTAVTGFPPGTVNGTMHAGDPAAAQAQLDLLTAYNDAAGRTAGAITAAGNLGGQILTPGLYKSTSSLEISSGDLTLDAQGDANAVFIFQMASTLTTTVGRQVILSGGAKAANVFWQVGSSATLGTSSVFKGNILALASITVTTGAAVQGRLLARTGAVTLDSNIVGLAIPADPSAPAVTFTFPANGATGVPLSGQIAATFSEVMEPSTISTPTFILKRGTTTLAGPVTYVGLTAIKSLSSDGPISPLSVGPAPVVLGSASTFAVLAASTVTSTGPTTVNGDLGLSPGTALTGFPPGTVNGTIHAGDPAAAQAQLDLTTAYNDAAGRTNDAITVAGNLGGQTLTPGLYKSTTSLEISSGDLTLDAQGDENAVFLFQMGSTFTMTSGRQVILSGGAQAANVVWQVGSSATLGTGSVFKGNILAMASITVTTGATVEGRLLARTAAVTLDSNDIRLPVLTNTPPGTLEPLTTYTATMTTAARDLAGNPLPADFVWTFTTGATLDTTRPIVTATVPPANAPTNVAISAKIALAFSEAMDPLTVSSATFTLKQGTTTVVGTVSYAGVTATFTPASALAPLTTYTARMTTGARDLAGNAPVSDFSWSFTTGATPDTTAPTVSTTVPANAATAVPINQTINATFSEAMDPLTMSTANLTLTGLGGTAVLGTVTYDVSSRIATLNPISNLAPNAVYTASITVGARDLAGNALGANFVWSFTTAATTAGQAPVALGAASTFAILAASTVIGTGSTTVNGDLGLSPGTAVTGFPPGAVNGTVHVADAAAAQAQFDLTTAYNDAAGRTAGAIAVAGNLGGQTLTPGLYKSTSSLEISSGDLTLDAQGDANAVFIFQMASTLTTTAGRQIILSGGARAANVFWQVGSSATLGTGSVFKGNILAMASITVTTGAITEGRLLARTAAVTLDSNVIGVAIPAGTTAFTLAGPAPVALGSASTFAVLAASTITSTGPTTINGDLGLSPGTAVTGFPPGTVNGTIHAGDPAAAQAQLDLTTAYNNAAGQTAGAILVVGNLGGQTLTPGLYKSTSSLEISSGDLTLDAQGDTNALFIFQTASTLTTTVGRQVILTGGAQAANVVWQVGSSATLGTSSVFKGNILAMASITLTTGATVEGRLLARTAAVTLDSNVIGLANPGGTDTAAPTVSSTVPVNAATGVAISGNISASFSEAMDPLTINTATFTLNQGATAVAGTVSYAGGTATFTPAANLAPLTTYTATVTTGAKDLAGNALAADFVWTFTTGATPDTTRPTVSATVPANAATGVAINETITAAFSEAMDPLTISTASLTLKQGTTAVAGTISYAGVTATFTPASALAPLTTYAATVTSGARDLAGNALATDFSWSFTTGATPDTSAPTVSATVPANAATDVPINQTINATFSEAMDPLTIDTAGLSLTGPGTTAVVGTVSYSVPGTIATFTPAINLAPNTVYTATVTTGVKDLAGNPLAANFVWSFTSAATTAGQAPVALGAAGAFAVLGASTVTSTGATTVNGDLGLSPGTAVTGFFAVDGGPGIVNGTIYNLTPGPAATAQGDLTTAFNDAAGRTVGAITLAGNLGGQTLTPGLYKSTSSLEISSGDLTLDAQGDANAVFIFQMASTLTTTSGRQVILSGGAKAANVYWQVGSSATLGTTSIFKGNILAFASITVTTGAAVEGRLLARTAAVTLDANTVTIPAP